MPYDATPIGKPFQPLEKFPLTTNDVFETYADALAFASGPTATQGWPLRVKEADGTTTSYTVNADGTLYEIGSYAVDTILRVSPLGDDSDADGSETKPYKTLSAALNSESDFSGKTILILPGVEGTDGTATINKPNVTIRGTARETCHLTLSIDGAVNFTLYDVSVVWGAIESNGINPITPVIRHCRFS